MIGQFQIFFTDFYLRMNVFVELQAKLQTCLAMKRHSYITDARSIFKRTHVIARDAPIKEKFALTCHGKIKILCNRVNIGYKIFMHTSRQVVKALVMNLVKPSEGQKTAQ